MKAKLLILSYVAATLLIASQSTFAHHGTAAYDTTSMITVTATMTDFQFVNPHVRLFFDVKGDKGEMEHWQGELTAPNKLARAGWTKHTLKPGDKVTMTGYVLKGGAHSMWIQKLIGPDGKPLQLFED
jgi:hypothetical protein